MPDWKSRELFSSLVVPPDIPVIVRVDGWRFRRVADELGLSRPYDRRLMEALVDAPKNLMLTNFPLALAFVFSDEISFVVAPPLPWGGRVEKLITILASYTASRITRSLNAPVGFDGRVVLVRGEGEIVDYLVWRQGEAWRNALNSYALKALEDGGMDRKEAAEYLKGKKAEELHEIIFEKLGINLAKVPTWQRRGVVVRKVLRTKETKFGLVERRVVEADWDPPLFSAPEGRSYLISSLRTGMSVF